MTLRAVVRRSTGYAGRAGALAVIVASAALLLAACQAMFTYTPLSGLKRPPASMTPAQRLTYAADALASGNTDDMKAAYDAIKSDSGAQAQYLTAQLGIELSGIPTLLVQVASDPSSGNTTTQLNDVSTFVTTHNLNPQYIVDAAAQLTAAQTDGANLKPTDQVMGAIGCLLGGAQGKTPAWDVTQLAPGDAAVTNAKVFIDAAMADVATLSSGDPLYQFVSALNTYIYGI